MSLSVELNGSPGDVGTILAKVQDDLHRLREKLRATGDRSIDLQPLEMAIERTQESIKNSAEKVINLCNNRVAVLPPVGPIHRRRSPVVKSMQQLVQSPRRPSPDDHKRIKKRGIPAKSPGERFKSEHTKKLLERPTHPVTKEILGSSYAMLQTSASERKGADGHPTRGRLAKGATVDHLTTLPHANRRDALLTPPPISNEDAQRGLLSLLERSLIPLAAEIILSPPLVDPRPAQLHSASQQFVKHAPADGSEPGANWVGVKLDPVQNLMSPSAPRQERKSSKGIRKESLPNITTNTTVMQPGLPPPRVSITTQHVQLQPTVETTQQPEEYRLVVENGHLLNTIDEFQKYRKVNDELWFSIERLMQKLEEIGRNFAIPLMFVNGKRLSELALHYELELKPSRSELLSCLENNKEVIQLLRMPGRRYKGIGGIQAAAAKIQATYQMHVKRSQYLEYRRMKWAAGVVTMSWLMYIKMCQVRRSLKVKRAVQLELMQRQQRVLRQRWSALSNSPHIIVHIPSQGYPHSIRSKLKNLAIRQSLQTGRLFDIRDPNVEVIYISPVAIKKDLNEYYHNLLALSPNPVKSEDKLHILTPEHLAMFSKQQMALSSVLLYSPRTMARIKALIAGREAYIVSNVVSADDLAVAESLGLPLLGSAPDIGHLYSSRSGAKRVFTDSKVNTPPTQGDVFSEDQLIEHLASLILSNLMVQRWMFKLNTHVQGKGFAFCDVAKHMECYPKVIKESQRHGEKWENQWAQEYALKQVMDELPQVLRLHAQPVDKDLFPSWKAYLDQFLMEGGVIEGCPPSDSVTPLTVGLFLDPAGTCTILYTGDQLQSSPYNVWGITCPQTSFPPEELAGIALRVATACQSRGITGYLSVDFLTFIHPVKLSQELWGIDLDIGYSDHLALFRLLTYITGAVFDPRSGQLLVDGNPRYAVMSAQLYHTNLCIVHYPVFFKMCKAHHIGYNAKEKQGTLFNFIDETSREHLTMICLKDTLQKALDTCSANLSIIHQEISTPNQQGHTNFEEVCAELDKISALMKDNANDHL